VRRSFKLGSHHTHARTQWHDATVAVDATARTELREHALALIVESVRGILHAGFG